MNHDLSDLHRLEHRGYSAQKFFAHPLHFACPRRIVDLEVKHPICDLLWSRVSTDDLAGGISAYVGEGAFTKDKLQTFGGYGVMKIKNLQTLMQYVCAAGFEHHVAVNLCQKADPIAEALGNYLGWQIYRHE